MLSPMATLLVTWAAVYAYVGVYFCTLHVRRPSHQEYLAFGLLSVSLVVWTAGAALGVDATTMREAVFAFRLEFLGGFMVMAYFVVFAALLAGRPPRLISLVGFGAGTLGIIADVGGWLIDATPRETSWGPAAVAGAIDPALTPVGNALLLMLVLITAYGIWLIARGLNHSPDLRALVWASSIGVSGGVYDAATRLLGGSSLYLGDHLALVPVLTVSFLLQRRFVRAADELGVRTAELRASYSELRVVQEELVRKEQLAAVGELSAVIAHEVRNPLAIIKNAVSGLRRSTLRAADRTVLLAILEEEVDRLGRLVRNLLDYARPVKPKARGVDLLGLAVTAAEVARNARDAPDTVEVAVETSNAPFVRGDPALLEQVFTNLAANAMQAMPDGGTVTIRARQIGPPKAVRLEFTDSGSGMDEAALAKALDPFFTTRPAGTGLGLAIVDRVLRNHGGSITLRSEPEQGTTALVTVPCERVSTIPGVP